jgi:hypothetical protein
VRSVRALALTMLASCHAGGASSSDRSLSPPLAVVRSLGGTVHTLRAGAVDWSAISDGTRLYEDDRLRTFSRAWAQLELTGGSALRVEEESLIAIGGGITIERGSVAGELAAGLRLRTPTLEAETAAARDIIFR